MVTGAGLPQRSTATLTGPAPGCVEGEGAAASPALKCYAAQGEYVDQVGVGVRVRSEEAALALYAGGVEGGTAGLGRQGVRRDGKKLLYRSTALPCVGKGVKEEL